MKMQPQLPSENSGAGEITTAHDRLIFRLLADPRKEEALQWLQGGHSDDIRILGRFKTNLDSVKCVQRLYDAGALEVFTVHIRKKRTNKTRSVKLVVTLPCEPHQRALIFNWCETHGRSIGYTPNPDHGESHLYILLD
ncbi:MAG: hypothetical protein ABSF38_19835 [Verrucomicrobiota bacterium]